jgi:hypothetical protein
MTIADYEDARVIAILAGELQVESLPGPTPYVRFAWKDRFLDRALGLDPRPKLLMDLIRREEDARALRALAEVGVKP